MTRLISLLSSALIAYFVYGFYLSQYDFNVIDSQIKTESSSGWYDYKGVMNVHSNLSIGSSNYSQIIGAAKTAGLDFLIFTDLNIFNTEKGFNNYFGETLVLSGGKYSFQDSRLIYFTKNNSSLASSLGDAQLKLSDMISQNPQEIKDSFVLLAHPFLKGFSWNGEIPIGLDGIEVINPKSISGDSWKNSVVSVLWSLLTYPFNPELSFVRLYTEPENEWELFDKLSQSRKLNAYAGAEASARALPLANYLLKFPSYQRSFEMFNQHVLLKSELTGHPENDKIKIFSALKKGNFYLSFDLIGDPTGFISYIEDRDKKIIFGSQLEFNKHQILVVKLPSKPKFFFEVLIIKNGERVGVYNSEYLEHKIDGPGVYRVQVRVSPYFPLPDAKKWVSWIYTNPYFIH